MNSKNNYIGQKGYTILKKDCSEEQQQFIKKELTIKPFVKRMGENNQCSFFAYRESQQKIYMPRYFGEKHFGKPKEIKLPLGENISLEFQGQLREHQVPVIEAFRKNMSSGGTGGLFDLPCAAGKTTIGLYIISMLKKKTIILVHKEFLMNQWIERISQFLPTARVGKLQGNKIEVEGKDIVIAMIQSLAMKEYPVSLFESFGFMIIDEVHHIASEVFSNTLFKLVTPVCLGLSATMNRKDGTSFVFKMFLGEVIYRGERKKEHSVVVRSVEFFMEDEDYNKVITNFRGETQYSSMITKLCDCPRRTEFILKMIKDMLVENTNQQIMVLAHNKSLLKYMYDAISERNIASVGYYVGGMKEHALKESESKKIIIATYSMASEGLDIKTLTTLIMTTPKTDIEQTVGRILREKHSQPVVVDIVDSHDVFKKQWMKRMAFYKKQQYKIIQTKWTQYNSDLATWKTLYESGVKKSVCLKDYESDSNEETQTQSKCLLTMKKK